MLKSTYSENCICARRSLSTIWTEVAVLIGSAFILSLAFPGFIFPEGLGFIAFFALIPVFAVIDNTSWKLTPFYGFLFGFTFYLFFNYWLKTFHALAIILVPVIKGAEMLLMFPCLKAASKWFGKRLGHWVQALIWVAYAYMSQSWFAGYPYGTICYALYKYHILIQVADLTGIWFIIFMMIAPQAYLGSWLQGVYDSRKMGMQPEKLTRRAAGSKASLIVYAVLFLFWVVYGIVSFSYWGKQESDMTWRIAAIQHNADSWKGGYTTYKRNFNNLRKMSLEALTKNPDMIIWSETAFVPSVSWHTNYPNPDSPETAELVKEFVEFGKSLPVPLVTGNPEGVLDSDDGSAYDDDGNWKRKDYNTVILFDDGAIKETYRKQQLVPFTEHFPYQKQMPWLYNLLLANDYNWWEKGTESVVFETTQGVKFSTPICYEDVFGKLCADFVKNGADILLNMTNDSWSGCTEAELQHAAIGVFRSVENRRTTVRSTNSGISCMINPQGKIIDPMDPFRMYWHIYDVEVYTQSSHGTTVYTQYNDYLALICKTAAFVLLALGGAWYFIGYVQSGSTRTSAWLKKRLMPRQK